MVLLAFCNTAVWPGTAAAASTGGKLPVLHLPSALLLQQRHACSNPSVCLTTWKGQGHLLAKNLSAYHQHNAGLVNGMLPCTLSVSPEQLAALSDTAASLHAAAAWLRPTCSRP